MEIDSKNSTNEKLKNLVYIVAHIHRNFLSSFHGLQHFYVLLCCYLLWRILKVKVMKSKKFAVWKYYSMFLKVLNCSSHVGSKSVTFIGAENDLKIFMGIFKGSARPLIIYHYQWFFVLRRKFIEPSFYPPLLHIDLKIDNKRFGTIHGIGLPCCLIVTKKHSFD